MAKLTDEEIVEIEMIANYPFIEKVESENGNVFTGVLSVCDEDYNVTVAEKPNKIFTCTLPENLTHLQTSFSKYLEESNPKSILECLNLLRHQLKEERSSTIPVNRCDKYRHVIRELSELTRFHLTIKSWKTNSDLSLVKFHSVDDRNREHPLGIEVNWNGGSNEIFQVAHFDLPLAKDGFKASHSLRDVYEQFKGYVEKLQPFFDFMEALDEHCWVLDPVPPQRSCKYRRISIGDNISMILTVDPLNVTHIPDIKFLGPEKLAENFRVTVNEKLENWDEENDLLVEILHLIGLKEFPQKKILDEGQDDLLVNSGECNICFSQRLNNKLPEIVCKNDFCRNFYHVECLYEWLMSINSKRVFKEVIGNCPNCEKNISCPIPN